CGGEDSYSPERVVAAGGGGCNVCGRRATRRRSIPRLYDPVSRGDDGPERKSILRGGSPPASPRALDEPGRWRRASRLGRLRRKLQIRCRSCLVGGSPRGGEGVPSPY